MSEIMMQAASGQDGGGSAPASWRGELLLLLVPSVALLAGLLVLGSGVAWGASGQARGLAILVLSLGSVAAARILACLPAPEVLSLPHGLMRLALGSAVLAAGYFAWCSLPLPAGDRARLLFGRRNDPADARTFRIVALENLFPADPEGTASGDTLLALAVYREQCVKEPAAGLFLGYLAGRGFLAFSSPEDVVERIPRALRAAGKALDFTRFQTAFDRELWALLHAPLLPGADPAVPAGAPAPRDTVRDSSGNGTPAAAREALCRLARDLGSPRDSRFHQQAARSLALLERGPEAGLELLLARITAGKPAVAEDPDTTARLSRLARSLLDQARAAGEAGQALPAARYVFDAIRTDPSCLPEDQIVPRQNARAWAEREASQVEAPGPGEGTGPLAFVRGGRDTQIGPWSRNRRLIHLAHGLSVLGDKRQALSLLGRIDPRTLDPYGQHVVNTLGRAGGGP